MPFGIVSYIFVLVALDYLGFGLPPGTPSWGRLLKVGSENINNYPQLVYFPILAVAGTLFCEIQQSSNLTYRLWDWGRRPARLSPAVR